MADHRVLVTVGIVAALLLSMSLGTWAGDVLLELDLSAPPAARDASRLKQTIKGARSAENFVKTDREYAYFFDGLTDRLVVDPAPALRDALRHPFTVEVSFCFHLMPKQTQSYPTLIAGLDNSGKMVWGLRGNKYTDRCHFHAALKTGLMFGPRLEALQWHHAAVCFDGKELVGYLDGVRWRETTPWTGLDRPFQKIVIGQGSGQWQRFSGLLRGVKITRGVLYDKDTSEAAQRANAEKLRTKSREHFEALLKTEDPAWEKKHPFMLFTWDEIPALKARLAKGRGPELLRHFLQACDEAIDPNHRRYVSPDTRLGLFQDRYWPGCSQALLPLATILTGDEKYVRHGIKLMMTTARTVGYYDIAEKDGASFAAAAGTAMTLALGYDWAYRWMTPEQRRTVRETLLEIAAAEFEVTYEKHFQHFWVRNWNAMGISALGHAALAIQGETLAPAHDYLYTAKRLAEEYFNNAVGRDGGFVEGMDYFYYGVQHLIVFAATLAHSTEYDLFETTHLKRVPEYLPYCLVPWGRECDPIGYVRPNIPLNMHVAGILRDCLPGKASDWFWSAAYGPDPYQWMNMHYWMLLWYRPEPNVNSPGLPMAMHFRDRGLVKMRTGWDPDALAAGFEAEWARVGAHDQADKGNFTINGYGGRWAVDSSGRHSPNTGSTLAHNLVTVDGKGQALFYMNSMTEGFILDYCHVGGWATSTEADLTNAYCYGHSLYLTRRDINQFRHVRRRFTMMREAGGAPPYFLVIDDIDQDGKPHEYTWHLHSFGMNHAALADNRELVVTKNWPKEVRYLVHPLPEDAGPGPGGDRGGSAEFDIDVPADGEYTLWGLGRAGDACPGGMDSWFLSLGECKNIIWSGGHNLYYKWLAVPGTFQLTKGRHTLLVRMREPEARVARFYLTNQKDTAPVGWKPPTGPGRILVEAAVPTRLTAPMTTGVERIVSKPAGMRAVPLWPPSAKPGLGTFAPDSTCTQHLYTLRARTVNPHFTVLIYPHKPGMPSLRIRRQDGQFELDWGSIVDRVFIRTDRAIDADDVVSDADLVVFRQRANGPLGEVAFLIGGGSRLTVKGQLWADLAGEKGTVMVCGEKAAVAGERVRTFRVLAPKAEHVSAFGSLIEFTKKDGMVSAKTGFVKPPTVLRWN